MINVKNYKSKMISNKNLNKSWKIHYLKIKKNKVILSDMINILEIK